MLPDWGEEDWYIAAIGDVPALAGLAISYSPKEIWQAAFHVLGYPATWAPSQGDIDKMKHYLDTR